MLNKVVRSREAGHPQGDTDLRRHSSSHLHTPFHSSPMQNTDLKGNRRASSVPPRDPLLSNTELQCCRGSTFVPCEHNNRVLFQSCTSPGFCEHLRAPADTQTNRALFSGDNSRGQGSRTACMSCHIRNSSPNHGMPPSYEQQSSHSNFEQRNFLISAEPGQRQRNCVSDLSANHQANNLSANQENSIHFDSKFNICCQEPLYRLLRPHQCRESPCLGYADRPHPFHHEQYLLDAEASAVGNCSPGHQFVNFSPHCVVSPALDQHRASTGLGSKGVNYQCFRAVPNEVTLYNWYLIRPSGSRGSEIAVGGFLSNRALDFERVETAIIVKRLEECKLLTKDGNVVNLVGSIDDFRTVSNGFSLQTVQLFISGFPHIWNLVVGMGLPNTKGTNTYLQSCDLYGGEVTSQINLEREAVKQGTCFYQPPRADTLTSCRDNSKGNHGLEFATEEAQAVEMAPASVVEQHQGATLLATGVQSNMEPLMLYEKTSNCRTEADVGMEAKADHVKETLQDRSSHSQQKGPNNQENMNREDVEAPIAVCRSEDYTLGPATVEPKKDDNEGNQVQVEVGASADVHLENVQSEEVGPVTDCVNINGTCDENSEQNIELSFVPSCELDASMTAEATCTSLLKRKKVTFTSVDEIEGTDPSYLMADVIEPTKGIETASLSGADKNMIEEETVVRKGKRKKKGRYFVHKLKRSSKSMKKGQRTVCVEVAAANTSSKDVSMEGKEDGQVMDGEDVIGAETEVTSPKNSSCRRREPAVDTGKAVFCTADDVQVGHRSSTADLGTDAGVVVKKENTKIKGKRRTQAKLWKRKPKRSRTLEDSRQVEGDYKSLEDKIVKTNGTSTPKLKRRKSKETDLDHDLEKLQQKKVKVNAKSESDLSTFVSTKKRGKILPPPLPLPLVSVSKQLVSKAFGLKTSRSGRLLVPPLAHWRNQSVVRDKDGGIVAIEGVSDDTAKEDTGLFNFRPPVEARAKKLQKWLSVTATECFKACQQQRARLKQK